MNSFLLQFEEENVQYRAEIVQWVCVSNSRERKCDFSLDFPAFRPSILDGARSKVVQRGEGYAWAPILWSSDNFKR